jgi:hypothetical protein
MVRTRRSLLCMDLLKKISIPEGCGDLYALRFLSAINNYCILRGKTIPIPKNAATDYLLYSFAVRLLTENNVHLLDGIDKRGHGFVVDHIIPIRWCFRNGVPIHLAASVKNLQVISSLDNILKGNRLLHDYDPRDYLYWSPVDVYEYDVYNLSGIEKVETLDCPVWCMDVQSLMEYGGHFKWKKY